MKILLLETATDICSVALSENGKVVAQRESDDRNAHSTNLPLFVKDLLVPGLDAVCVSSGPGSYTGLRIGVSTAKGICYALGIPLLSVPTLLSMASLYYQRHPEYRGLVCPMIDARRMECYTMIVGPDCNVLRETQADVVTAELYASWLGQSEMMFIGNGAEKTRPILQSHSHALYDSTFTISAEGLLAMAERRLAEGKVENVAYFEPFYLKDFVAKKSVVHGLR